MVEVSGVGGRLPFFSDADEAREAVRASGVEAVDDAARWTGAGTACCLESADDACAAAPEAGREVPPAAAAPDAGGGGE
jgi:hypothetical protein